ncbi:MAG: STAS domain-containing protein [Spirochaetales bacterium]|nr:STAS domain-containing protein [Spirochaetales bacterium]
MNKTIELNQLIIDADKKDDGNVKLSLTGKLETQNSNSFLRFLGETIEGMPSGGELDLNLEKLLYASSTGIGSFASALVQCQKKSISLTIWDMQGQIKDVMDLLGFSSFFTFKDSK